MQRRDCHRSHKKFGTALAPTANSSRWDVQEAYRGLFATPVDPDEHTPGGTHVQSQGPADDPFLTPEYKDILTKEWNVRRSQFSSKLKSRFLVMDEKKQERKERQEMWEKLRRKFRMLR